MKKETINRVNYRNPSKKTDFEIVTLKRFFATRPHKHLGQDFRLNFWSVIYIREGVGEHYVDFRKYNYKPGDILFIQKNQVHHFVVNESVKGYLMHINEPFFYKMEGFNGEIFLEFADTAFGSPCLSFSESDDSTFSVLAELMLKEYNRDWAEVSEPLLASLFQSFILALRQQSHGNEKVMLSKDYEHFKEYRQLVEAHFTKTRSVEAYAGMMHLSKKTVNQATRNVVGLSAKQFIINRLILEIKRYLSQGEMMNYEIADLLGFGDAANMTKFFKHYEGLSPKEFRSDL